MKKLKSHLLAKQTRLTKIAFASAIYMVLFQAFSWLLPFVIQFLLTAFTYLMFLFIFAVIFVASILNTILWSKSHRIKALLPVGINIATAIIWTAVPLSNFTTKAFFWLTYNKRMEAVEWVTENLNSDSSEIANYTSLQLPQEYQFLSSDGGDALVEIDKETEDIHILFFAIRGVIDNFSGFAYTSATDTTDHDFFDCDYTFYEPLDEHWYYIVCT